MRSIYDCAIHKPLKYGAISAAQIHAGKREKHHKPGYYSGKEGKVS